MKKDDGYNKKQFQKGFDNPLSKKILKIRQADEYQRIDKRAEGVCYLCFKKDFVSATLIDICFDCAAKKGQEPILKVQSRSPYGYCLVHGGYSVLRYKNNIAQVNVRLCLKCTQYVAEKHQELVRKGSHKVDPFWLSMRRKWGKDYEMLGYGHGSYRR